MVAISPRRNLVEIVNAANAGRPPMSWRKSILDFDRGSPKDFRSINSLMSEAGIQKANGNVLKALKAIKANSKNLRNGPIQSR